MYRAFIRISEYSWDTGLLLLKISGWKKNYTFLFIQSDPFPVVNLSIKSAMDPIGS